MSLLRRLDLLDPFNYYYTTTTTTLAFPSPPLLIADDDDLLIADYLDLLPPKPTLFDSITDLFHPPSFRRIIRIEEEAPSLRRRMRLRSLRERVAELEAKFERVVADGKYTCTAEIEGEDVGRKYKWTAEVKGGKKKEEKWSAEVCEKKGKGKKYKWTSEVKGVEDCSGVGEYSGVKEKGKKIKDGKTRIVEIEENGNGNGNGNGDANADDHHGALVLKQAFAKRSRASQNAKGKKKQLSPQDAAMMIQINFRAYLIRRSMALRALRELAVAKAKLKELRALFNNFSYRRRVAQDAEERQKFSEKIIVLLLTVDAIEGPDVTVRGAKKSMIDELEAMLDVIDPQPCGKSLSMRRRTFDMPDGVIRKEIADGVAQVCQMLEGEENSSSTFEACL